MHRLLVCEAGLRLMHLARVVECPFLKFDAYRTFVALCTLPMPGRVRMCHVMMMQCIVKRCKPHCLNRGLLDYCCDEEQQEPWTPMEPHWLPCETTHKYDSLKAKESWPEYRDHLNLPLALRERIWRSSVIKAISDIRPRQRGTTSVASERVAMVLEAWHWNPPRIAET